MPCKLKATWPLRRERLALASPLAPGALDASRPSPRRGLNAAPLPYAVIFIERFGLGWVGLWLVRDGPVADASYFLTKCAAQSHAKRILSGRRGQVVWVASYDDAPRP